MTTLNDTTAPVTRRPGGRAANVVDWRRRPEPANPSWEDRAACLNRPEEWWDGDSPVDAEKARRTCLSCPVLETCLRERMEEEGDTAWARYGIRGGLTGGQRIQLFVDEWSDGPYDAEEARLIALEAEAVGRPAAAVADGTVGETTVRLAARLAGEQVAPRKLPSATERRGGTAVERAFAQAGEIMQMRQDGVSVKEIGKRLTLGRAALDEVLRAYRKFEKPAPQEPAGEPDLDAWLKGEDIFLTSEQRLEALLRAVMDGKSYRDLDQVRGLQPGTTQSYVSRQRRLYRERGEVFPIPYERELKQQMEEAA